MTRDRYRITEPNQPHFLTCTIVAWQAVFIRPQIVQVVLDSWQFLQDNKRMEIFGYVILENHLHLIAQATDLAKEMGDFKSYTARRIVDYLKESGAKTLLQELEFYKLRHKAETQQYQLWQEGGHPELIQGEEMMRQKLEYMHYNPVRRGYVDDPVHWRYSSARNYAGLPGLITVKTDWQ
jgi:putative transposase